MKKSLSVTTIVVSTLLGLTTLIGALLFSLSVLEFGANLATTLFFVGEFVLLGTFILLCRAIAKASKKEKEILSTFVKKQSREQQLIDLYAKLGIPPVRDKDGKILNIYDLLQIKPQFDENNNRIPTIYEILGILPRFDKDGKEIPSVVFLKNSIKRVTTKEVLKAFAKNKLMSKDSAEVLKLKAQVAALAAANAAKKVATASKDAGGSSSGSKGKNPKRSQSFTPIENQSTKADAAKAESNLSGILKDLFNDASLFVGISRLYVEPTKMPESVETIPQRREPVPQSVTNIQQTPSATSIQPTVIEVGDSYTTDVIDLSTVDGEIKVDQFIIKNEVKTKAGILGDVDKKNFVAFDEGEKEIK